MSLRMIKIGLLGMTIFLTGYATCWAQSDMQMMEQYLKQREGMKHQGMDHSMHDKNINADTIFRGVFYGYLPCTEKDCDGIKMTLSLKQRQNYLLVTQSAKASTREYYDKGKYDWNESKHLLTLRSKRKDGTRLFAIKDDATLILLNSDGSQILRDADDYALKRSDTTKNRQVHIH